MSFSLLVLEDDAMVRRFLAMATERLGVQTTLCASMAEARQALPGRSFDAILTDLRLPDGSGLDFIASLQEYRTAHPQCHVLVSSGAVDEAVRNQLEALAVTRILPKPLELSQLQQLVAELGQKVGQNVAPSVAQKPVQGAASPPAPALALPETQAPVGDRRTRAMREHFGGNERLFNHYESLCLAHFPDDIARADAALNQADWTAMQHCAHNLKTVLRLLGWDDAALLAASLEEQATSNNAEATRLWEQLRADLTGPVLAGAQPAAH